MEGVRNGMSKIGKDILNKRYKELRKNLKVWDKDAEDIIAKRFLVYNEDYKDNLLTILAKLENVTWDDALNKYRGIGEAWWKPEELKIIKELEKDGLVKGTIWAQHKYYVPTKKGLKLLKISKNMGAL
jgi:hypothetical protein